MAVSAADSAAAPLDQASAEASSASRLFPSSRFLLSAPPFFFGAGFGFFPFAYPIYNPFYPYPYQDYGYGYPSSSYGNGYSPSPAVVIYQSAPAPTAYSASPPQSQSVRPEISEYPATSQSQKYEPPIYLISFKNQESIRAAQAYWVEGDALQYITLQHEHKQAPLDSVDRAFTYWLNRERHVDFRLPPE